MDKYGYLTIFDLIEIDAKLRTSVALSNKNEKRN